MGRWVYKEAKRESLTNYFRSYFFAGLICNFIGLIAGIAVKYYDDEITAAKWKGVFAGLGFSVSGFGWAIFATSVLKNGTLAIFTLLILLSGILFGIFYKYKSPKAHNMIKAPINNNISTEEMVLWVQAYLRNIGLNEIAIGVAISDGNVSQSYNLIRKRPSISKEDFLIEMEMYEFL